MRTLRLLGALVLLLTLVAGATAGFGDLARWGGWDKTPFLRITYQGHLQPGTTATYDLGSSSKLFRNVYCSNLTATNQTFTTPTIGGAMQCNSTLTVGGAIQGNSTATIGGATVLNSTANVAGLLTTTGGIAGGIYTLNSTNTTFTASNSDIISLVNMSGNHTLTLPAVSTASGRTFRIIEVCNKIGGTGNLTLNATSSGNVNRVDSVTVTNTAGATGNVSQIICTCDPTYGWAIGVERR